jgi:hypothetical protein
MDLTTEGVSESPFESVIVSDLLAQEERSVDQHAEINARRAQIEDPEMLRRLRSL